MSGLANWRAVYDANGDDVEDDPGSIEFLRRRQARAQREQPPFGDSFADGSITVSNGQHTFQVRALNDSGTLLATNTVTATIGTGTPPPPPPPSSTGAVTQTIANGATIPGIVELACGVRQERRQASRTTPARSSSSSTASRCSAESNPPFGDSFADGSITVSNGQHTFQVRALNDSGTLLATNTVTATIGNQAPPRRRRRRVRRVR